MATIREIAEKIGVSPTTVSNVINGHTAKVSPETLEKVEKALEEFQYGRQITGAPVTTQVPFIAVGFGMDHSRNMMMDPFCGELFGAIEQAVHQYDRHVLYFTPETEDEVLKVSAPWNVEGVIMLGWRQELCGHLMRRCSKPVVFVDSFFGEGVPEYDNVGLQDYRGAYDMTAFLIRQGHSRIAYLCDQEEPIASSRDRMLGCRAALEAAGLTLSGRDSYYIPTEKYLRHEVLRQFIREHRTDYTALFFDSDFYASDAINVFYSQGLQIPDEISAVGFDDNLYAQLSRPALTTVRQSPTEKGRQALKLLMQKIRGEKLPVSCVRLPAELIVRDSVRNIRK